ALAVFGAGHQLYVARGWPFLAYRSPPARLTAKINVAPALGDRTVRAHLPPIEVENLVLRVVALVLGGDHFHAEPFAGNVDVGALVIAMLAQRLSARVDAEARIGIRHIGPDRQIAERALDIDVL